MCVYGCLRDVAVATELKPKDATFRPGAKPPGGTRSQGAPLELFTISELRGPAKRVQQVQQASTGPAIFNGSSRLQRVQQSSTGPAGPITDQKGPKSPKTDQTPGKPDAGIALQGQITLVLKLARPPQGQNKPCGETSRSDHTPGSARGI